MKRSPIKLKKCKCGCDKHPSIGCGGYNYGCNPEKKKELVDRYKLSKRVSAKKSIKAKKAVSNSSFKVDLNEWFDWVIQENIIENPFCWECGSFIPQEYYRHAVAHIFPKSEDSGFPSISTHPLNFLILGSECGCHDKTHRIDTFVKMAIWKEAVSRFLVFELFIKERRKYLTLFKEAVENTSLNKTEDYYELD